MINRRPYDFVWGVISRKIRILLRAHLLSRLQFSALINHVLRTVFHYALISESIGRNDVDDQDALVSIANIIIISLYDTD